MVRVSVDSVLAQGALVGCVSSVCAPERGIWRRLLHFSWNNVYPLPHPSREGICFFDLLFAARCTLQGSVDVLVFAMKLNKSNDT